MGQGQGSPVNKIKLRWWWGLEEGSRSWAGPLLLWGTSPGAPTLAGLGAVRGESKAQIQGLEAESRPGGKYRHDIRGPTGFL